MRPYLLNFIVINIQIDQYDDDLQKKKKKKAEGEGNGEGGEGDEESSLSADTRVTVVELSTGQI
jgi:hypothetical protein